MDNICRNFLDVMIKIDDLVETNKRLYSKGSQILHKIISTHILTVLTMRVILHTEQRKREEEIFQFH